MTCYCGSPAYVAPEVIDAKSYTSSVDIYSLGHVYFAIFKLIIVDLGLGKKWLVPAEIISNTNFELLNSILRNQKPSKDHFVHTYFRDSKEFGELVYEMVRLEPDRRPGLDLVLIHLVELKERHEMETQECQMRRRFDGLQVQVTQAHLRKTRLILQMKRNRLLTYKIVF